MTKSALARRRGSRPFPKRPELKPSVLGDDSTEDNDHSSDEDYHLSDEDRPKKRHRGKPAWATKPIPKKKPEYAVDRKLNGLAQKEGSTGSDPAKVNHKNSNTNSTSNNAITPAHNGGTNSQSDGVEGPAGGVSSAPGVPDELSEEDIAALENVDDLVKYVVQDDA